MDEFVFKQKVRDFSERLTLAALCRELGVHRDYILKNAYAEYAAGSRVRYKKDKAKYAKNFSVKAEVVYIERDCLSCNKKFPSKSVYNRMCDSCKGNIYEI